MSQVRFSTGAIVPLTVPSGQLSLYAKADKKLYYKDDTGAEIGPMGGGGGSGTVGPSNCVYLDVLGNDLTGTRGDASKPFQTFSAALAKCQDGDSLRMGPGVFTESATPVWPPAVKRLAIIGSGRGGLPSFLIPGESITRVVQTTPNEHVLVPPSDATLLVLQNFTADVAAAGSGVALKVDGTGGGGVCMSSGLHVSNMAFSAPSDSVEIKLANLAFFQDVLNWGGTWSLNTTSIVRCENILGLQTVYCTWDNTTPGVPLFGREESSFRGVSLSTLYLSGHPQIRFDESCALDTITTFGPGFTVDGGLAPEIHFQGYLNGVMNFTGGSALPNTGTALILDFTGAKINGNLNFEVAGYTPGNRQKVFLDNITTSGMVFGGSITAGDGVDIYLRTGAIPLISGSIILTTLASGTITPSRWLMAVPVGGAGLDPVPFGFTAQNPPLNVQATMSGLPVSLCISQAPPPSASDLWVSYLPPGPPMTVYVECRWA